MDFDEDNSVAACSSAFYGAIFMSNRATKSECFKRKLFGLPLSQIPYVKKIKSGMILFLFEYEERKLYGVYKATCDGAVDIDPNAFSLSGKFFSAQIRFSIISLAPPLSEHEFSDAIKDNYYTFKKFHFYLSREQVEKLVELFHSRKTNIQRPLSLGTGKKAMKQSKDYLLNSNIRVTFKNDSVEDDVDMDNIIESNNLSSDPNLYRPSLNLSGYYKQSVLNTNGSIGDGEQLSLTLPHSSELRISDSMPSMSHNDGTVNLLAGPHHDHPYFHRAHSLQYRPSSSSLGVDIPRSKQNITAYPKNLADSPFTSSRKHLYQCHTDSTALDTSSTDYLSLDVTPNHEHFKRSIFPEHYGPSCDSIPFSRSRYFEKNIDFTSLEDYEGLPFHDEYEPHNSMSRTGRFGEKSITNSPFPCSPGNNPSQLCDHRHPATSLHGGGGCEKTQAWCYEPSTASVPLSEAENFRRILNPLHFSSGLESVYEGGYGGFSFHHPTHHEEYCPTVMDSSLRSDSYNKKTSVFSRLSVAAEASEQDENYETNADLSDSELMDQLSHQRRKGRMYVIKKSKSWNMQNSENHTEIATDMDMIAVDALDSKEELEDSNGSDEGNEIPFLNFKRRSSVRKTASETETETCIDDGATSGKSKRRKLIRPSFNELSSVEGTVEYLNVDGSSQVLCGSHVSVLNEAADAELGEVPATKAIEGDMDEGFSQEPSICQKSATNVKANDEVSSLESVNQLPVGNVKREGNTNGLSTYTGNESSSSLINKGQISSDLGKGNTKGLSEVVGNVIETFPLGQVDSQQDNIFKEFGK